MKNGKRVFSALLIACLLALAAAGCGGNSGGSSGGSSGESQPANQDQAKTDAPSEGEVTYKFAFMAPLTGDAAQYGLSMEKSAKLRVEMVNNAGGINGGKIVVDYFDDKNDATEAVNIANKIIADDSYLGVCGPFGSTVAMAVAPIFEKAGITMFSPTASHPDLTGMGDYIFRGTRTQTIETGEYVRFMYDTLNARKVGMLYAQNDWGLSIKEVFEKDFTAKGGELVIAEPYIVGQTTDFSTLLTKIKAQDIDTFFFVAQYDDAAKVIKQAHSLDLEATYVGPSNMMTDEFIALLGDEAEGIFLMTGFVPGNTEPAYVEANDAYKAMFNGEEIDQYGMGAYDTIAMFADACAEVGADRAAIKDWLYGMVEWEGSSGLYTMTETGDPLKPCYPMIIKDGKFIQYQE